MVFSSLLFLFYFLPITIFVYYIAPRKFKNLVLFISSLIFYAWGEPVYIVLMLFSTVVDYSHGRLLEYYSSGTRAKLILASSVIINLSLLIFFKYSTFLIGSFNNITGSSFTSPNLALPIGISFYTFQTMSYTIDVYRKEATVQRSFISFGAYVSMFPQLIAGPIVRYQTIADQIVSRRESWQLFSAGVTRFIIGLSKKVLLANQIGGLWATVQESFPNGISAGEAWLGMLAFTFQIYFDFSGYSDMAIGLGQIFGFQFPENFNYPYISKSITEFWRRWHISLGTWFREYLYIPLGGNRCSLPRQIVNIMIVWILTGLWHGASWNFAIWGISFGILMLIEKYIIRDKLEFLPIPLRQGATFIIFILVGVIFNFEELSSILKYYHSMMGFNGLIEEEAIYLLKNYGLLLVICFISMGPWASNYFKELYKRNPIALSWLSFIAGIISLLLCIAYLVDTTYNPFLYFRF